MIKIINKNMCSGCHACANICPENCIKMASDNEGFLYPRIETTRCIDCRLCEKVCQSLTKNEGLNSPQAYACRNTNEVTREKSSSGGIFSLLAEGVIESGGVVFGAAFNNETSVSHIHITNIDDLDKLRGSKYIQSTVGEAFKTAKNYLDSGRKVLFTGTPCQVDGLLNYLPKEYKNLITQDIICHGVPSPRAWATYLDFHKSKEGSGISQAFFRSKKFGWQEFSLKLVFENEKVYEAKFTEDVFMQGFLKNLYLRPSCYSCKSKFTKRRSDITLADFWGVEEVCPEMYDNKGVSLVLVNSPKGQKVFDSIREKTITKEVVFEEAIKFNPVVYESVISHPQRSIFFNKIEKERFPVAVERCFKGTITNRIKRKIKKYL